MLLKDQVALVTGAGRGIGRSIALTLAQEGAKIAVTARTKERRDGVAAEIVAQGGEARPFALDVTNDEEVSQAVNDVLSTWGQIDILVNNAAIITYNTPVWATPLDEWDAVMKVNLRGVFICSNTVIPHMIEREKGTIINIGSLAARVVPQIRGPGGYTGSPYAVSKWGVMGYTAFLGHWLRPYGILVNGINIGGVDTDMSRAEIPEGNPDWSTPEEIARVALFLATKAPRDMTGQSLDVFAAETRFRGPYIKEPGP